VAVSDGSLWVLVSGTCVGCYLLKIVGYVLPPRVLDRPAVRRAVSLLPVALLAALVVVELLAAGSAYDIDAARIAGFAVGGLAVWRRAPFIVVIVLAAVVAAVLRVVT
jgi:branched-subunit amino acid transport protein